MHEPKPHGFFFIWWSMKSHGLMEAGSHAKGIEHGGRRRYAPSAYF